jgi:hypothetical protein
VGGGPGNGGKCYWAGGAVLKLGLRRTIERSGLHPGRAKHLSANSGRRLPRKRRRAPRCGALAGLVASLVLRADVAGIKCSRNAVAAPPRASELALRVDCCILFDGRIKLLLLTRVFLARESK